ncbi:DUF5134 domain-containing protein [Streptomyces sp. NPDC005820]|uniref:DUF5134 domain-containing protein n=1 Tax=Streptomyces sp. NPDC005820 TaxID=3157069 RepID=UPI0033EFD9D2
MHGPTSPGWLLVTLCAATGAYCLLRMRSRVEEQRRAAGGEALMGFGMAVMAVPPGVFTPPPWAWPAHATVFGAATLRALWAARTHTHHLHHLVGTSAMVYMAVTMALAPPHAHAHGAAASGVPLLTGALLVYFTGYVLLSGARLLPVAGAAVTVGAGRTSGAGEVGGADGTGGTDGAARAPSSAGGAVGWSDRPELARACRLSMGIGMVAMLLAM